MLSTHTSPCIGTGISPAARRSNSHQRTPRNFHNPLSRMSLRCMLRTDLPCKSCLGVLIEYLRDFQLHSLPKVTSNFRHFSAQMHMQLPGSTLHNLEVIVNQVANTTRATI